MTLNHQLLWNEAKDYIGITLAALLYTFAFTFFLMPYEIVTGGVAGISVIVFYATGFPNAYTYFIINAVLLILALKILGWKFLVKTIFAICMNSLLFAVMKDLMPVDAEGNFVKILGEGQDFMSLIVGCSLTGTALGLFFLNNGSTGGSDIIAAIINKYRDISLGTILIFVDFVIIAACLFIPSLGTMLQREKMVCFGFCTMFIENFMLDYVYNKRRSSVQFLIFSRKYNEIADAISTELEHGVTILDGQGWYSKQEIKVVCILARRNESTAIFRMIKIIDPNAFVSQSAVIGVYGEGFDPIKVSLKKKRKELKKKLEAAAAEQQKEELGDE